MSVVFSDFVCNREITAGYRFLKVRPAKSDKEVVPVQYPLAELRPMRDSSKILNQMELGHKTNVITLSHASENPLSKRNRNSCGPNVLHISQRIKKQRLDVVPALTWTFCSGFRISRWKKRRNCQL